MTEYGEWARKPSLVHAPCQERAFLIVAGNGIGIFNLLEE
jgi:hypothetical protein